MGRQGGSAEASGENGLGIPEARKLLWLACEFSEIVGSLTEDQQNIVWEYVILSASQDRRLLEKALSLIDFSKNPLGRGAVLTDAGSDTEAGFPPNGDP